MKFPREPLLHFLLIGAALFAAYGLANREAGGGAEHVLVSAGQIEHMVATFARTRQRPPIEAELKGLIDQYVREEVLSREAIKLGLERNDVIIRRRLQQKMEFVAEDLAASVTPSDDELAVYLAENSGSFREDPRFTFQLVFLSAERRGDRLAADATRMLDALKARGAQAETSDMGDPSLLPLAFANEPAGGIEGLFGREFAAQLVALPVGEWAGPIRSGFGAYLVRVEQRTESRVPALEEVREQVLREWENERRIEANREFLERLLEQYEVTIEWPRAEAGAAAPK